MADTPNGETATPGDSKTTETTTATPQVNAVDTAEVERLKKEAEQARMRAQQLENELKAKREAEEAEKAKQLEEQNQYKSLWEQSQAKLKEAQEQREREERQKAIESGTQEVLSQFSKEVVEIAKEAGLSLNDTTDEAKNLLKEKLEKIQSKVVRDAQPTPNNPANRSTTNNLPSGDEMKEALRSEQGFHDLVAKLPSVQPMLKKQ